MRIVASIRSASLLKERFKQKMEINQILNLCLQDKGLLQMRKKRLSKIKNRGKLLTKLSNYLTS